MDQFAISEIFKIKHDRRRPDAPHAEFWAEAHDLLDRAIKLQQIICPASDIHRDETMVYRDGNELALVHEMMGGYTSFESTTEIEHKQIYRNFEAYLKGEDPPPFNSAVDEILNGHRNDWLSDLHVTVESDWSGFVDNVRRARESAARDFAPLYDRWARDKPKFDEVLKHELSTLASGYIEAYCHFLPIASKANETGYIDGALSPVVTLINELSREFVERGSPPESALQETARFLSWPKNESLPFSWISAHLFAAIAERLAHGQKRRPSRGMMNDIKAISLYGPYVDVMFLDNECASLIEEKAVARGVKLKARIFCLKRSDDFLAYLQELVESTPLEVVDAARDLYGID